MKKFYSLLKAGLSQDMSLFKVKAKSKGTKLITLIFLSGTLMFVMGSYAYLVAEPLYNIGLTYIVITLFMAIVSFMTFFEGIYKSSGILFEGRDNDLLFSLPIKKSGIFALRVIKLLLFQFIYNLIFLVPSMVVYAFYESPGVNFYLMSILMLVLLPIIPTILACIFGYIIKSISSRFKTKKLMQIILSAIILVFVITASSNLEGFIQQITNKAQSINEAITTIYYPIGAYIELINEFNVVTLLKLLVVNIVPLVATIYLGSIYYFKIISRSKSSSFISKKYKDSVHKDIVKSSQLKALIVKEMKRYFSTPVYIINTLFGHVLIFIATISLIINGDSAIYEIVEAGTFPFSFQQIYDFLPYIYVGLIMMVSTMSCISASSISIEGKNFNILKYVPVEPKKIFLAKILTSNIITIPGLIIAEIMFAIRFNVDIKVFLLYLGVSIVIPTFTAISGVLINLRFPKLNASSDTEIVKQSASSLVAVWLGLTITIGTVLLVIYAIQHIMLVLVCITIAFALLDIALWYALNSYGKKKFNQLSV